jgi:hypothetical protein
MVPSLRTSLRTCQQAKLLNLRRNLRLKSRSVNGSGGDRRHFPGQASWPTAPSSSEIGASRVRRLARRGAFERRPRRVGAASPDQSRKHKLKHGPHDANFQPSVSIGQRAQVRPSRESGKLCAMATLETNELHYGDNLEVMREKAKFLKSEAAAAAIAASLQRSRTYTQGASDEERGRLREQMREALEVIGGRYNAHVSEPEHMDNLAEFQRRVSAGCERFLEGRELRIGVAQKALNLYLKYLWCMGEIPPPPHCPFDHRLISLLGRVSSINWTEMTERKLYEELVKEAKGKAGGKSLAVWELVEWARLSAGSRDRPRGRSLQARQRAPGRK